MSEQIEGVPAGWRLVAIRRVRNGEWFIERAGRIELWKEPDDETSCWVHPVIEKIKQPKKYRPFANAAEFAPHRDRWVTCIEGGVGEDVSRVTGYDDFGVFVGACDDRFPYDEALETLAFEDLEPFGVEVTQ